MPARVTEPVQLYDGFSRLSIPFPALLARSRLRIRASAHCAADEVGNPSQKQTSRVGCGARASVLRYARLPAQRSVTGRVAQRAEQWPFKPLVEGSSPSALMIILRGVPQVVLPASHHQVQEQSVVKVRGVADALSGQPGGAGRRAVWRKHQRSDIDPPPAEAGWW